MRRDINVMHEKGAKQNVNTSVGKIQDATT